MLLINFLINNLLAKKKFIFFVLPHLEIHMNAAEILRNEFENYDEYIKSDERNFRVRFKLSAVNHLLENGFGLRAACRAVGLSTSCYYRERGENEINTQVWDKLMEIIEEHPSWGFDKCFRDIKTQQIAWNRKRVLRVYRKYILPGKCNG